MIGKILGFGTVLATALSASAVTYYASPNEGPDSEKDCTSSENAGYVLTAIQKAFDADARNASSPAVAILKEGTYDLSGLVNETPGTAKRLLSFNSGYRYMKVVGEPRDPERVRIVGPGLAQNTAFLSLSGGATIWLEGITITNFGSTAWGSAVSASTGDNGTVGNMFTNCVFSGCTASVGGAISFGFGSISPRHPIVNCKFIGNVFTNNKTTGQENGGGAVVYAVCDGCEFWNNRAADYPAKNLAVGGAVCNSVCSNCLFVGNLAYSGSTGGKYGGSGNSVMYNCVFSNTVDTVDVDGMVYGGTIDRCKVINCDIASSTYGLFRDCSVKNSYFFGNRQGCVLYGRMDNCLVVSNYLAYGNNNAGLSFGGARNCTFVGNTAPGYLKSVAKGDSYNCVFIGNTGKVTGNLYRSISDRAFDGSAVLKDEYTCVDANAKNYLRYDANGIPCGIKRSSPLFNAGTNLTAGAATIWKESSLDFAGNKRLNGPVDVGCFEWWPTEGLIFIVR